jgi:hypothetical protein
MKTAGLPSLSHLLTTALKPWRAARGFRSSDHGEQRLWSTWHRMYDENEHLQARLQVVRQTIREILDSYPWGKIRLISICSGDGRDILEAAQRFRQQWRPPNVPAY